MHALGSWRNRDELTNTEALIRAIEDPTFTVLGHPTGRILQGREGFPVDLHAVLRRMGELNSEGQLKAVEINASPYRLDLESRIDPEVISDLGKKGHKVEAIGPWGVRNGFTPLMIDPDSGVYCGGADPRKESVVLGW